MKRKLTLYVVLLSLFVCTGGFAQERIEMRHIKPLKLNGFRIGVTYIAGDSAKQEFRSAVGDDKAFPMITQVGWQFEWQFPAGENGIAAIIEVIPLIGGLNQGLVIPSMTTIIGLRTGGGYELGAGPIIHAAGSQDDPKIATGFVFAGGATKSYGRLNIPLNFAITHSRTHDAEWSGLRFTLMSGFAF